MTLCLILFLSPCLLLRALPHLQSSYCPPPAGSGDERAAAMMAWRASPPARLPVVDLPVSSRRAGRGAGRIRFRFRHGDLSPCLFRCLVSVAWLIPLAACFDELTFVSPVCFLSLLVSSCVSSLISDGVSLCLSWFQMCFSCVFSHRSPMGLRLLDLSPRPVSSVVSSFRLVMRLGRRHNRHVLA